MEGERAVGQLLEELRSAGYKVFHDVPACNGNIDHVLVGPAGVFAIETKTRSKRAGEEVRFDGEKITVNGLSLDRDPILQARGLADHLRQELQRRTADSRLKVRPVVLFPGWYVKQQGRADVWVLNEKALPAFLANEEESLSKDEVARFAACLADFIRAH